ncbi:hypothetical protein GGI20_004099 [Coemansia sp. BCRC 34301]|nr:hypothetical protein GGI20_004099 [Coemansia sp. BCRC 34301]
MSSKAAAAAAAAAAVSSGQGPMANDGVQADKWDINERIAIEKSPFHKLPVARLETADFVPRLRTLEKALEVMKLQIPPERLMQVVTQFLLANRARRNVHVELEQWRKSVLDAFNGDLQEITRAANMFAKLSPKKFLAHALYKVAAEEGYQNAAYQYAVIMGTSSIGIPGAMAQSLAIIKDLVALGHPQGHITLSDIKLQSGSKESQRYAVELLEKAWRLGEAAAAFRLGNLYRQGIVVERDYAQAIAWYNRASEEGAPEGHFVVGTMYSLGQGTADGKPDNVAAVNRMEQAAMAGSVEAQYNLGLFYMEGRGVEKNIGLTVEYWTMASAERFPVAMLNLAKLLVEGQLVAKDERRARNLLKAAIASSGTDRFIADQANMLLEKMGPEKKSSWCSVILLTVAVAVAGIQERVIQQPLDHFSLLPAGPQFSQRCYVDSRHYHMGGPILLYSVGERTALASDLSDGWIGELARETGGLALLLEQRFYGESIPDPALSAGINGTSVWQYLSVEQMVADIKRVAEHIGSVIPEWITPARHDRASIPVPLVLVGGSFAGSLMVWTKQRYPDLEALVVASSAPLNVVDGYWGFDKMVARRLPCAQTLSFAVREIDRILDGGNAVQIAELKRRFGLEHKISDVDFVAALNIQVSLLMQAPADAQSRESIVGYCSLLERPDLPAIEALAQLTREYGQFHRLVPSSECPETNDDLAWLWQQCTELGLWQTAPQQNSSSADEAAWFARRLRSRRLDAQYYRQQCSQCLPLSFQQSRRAEEQRAQFRSFAKRVLDAFQRGVPSSLLLTAGELDPWLSLTAVGHGVRLADNVMVVRNASHSEDLLPNPAEDGEVNPEVQIARSRIRLSLAMSDYDGSTYNNSHNNGDGNKDEHFGRFDEQQPRGGPPPAGFSSHGGQAPPPPPPPGYDHRQGGPPGQGQGYGHGGPPPPGYGQGQGYGQGHGYGGPPPGQQQGQGQGHGGPPPQGNGLQWVTASDGHIPPNPVQGGIESNGTPLFIARAMYKGGMHPGKAGQHLEGGGCLIGYGHKEVGLSEYQVLCGDASRLRWVAQDGLLNLDGCVPYPAGHEETNEPLYVAKTLHERSQQLGKCAPHIKKGMSFPYGRKELTAEKYMVLCYADAKNARPQ